MLAAETKHHTKQKWQEALCDLITDPRELFALLELDPLHLEAAYAATRLFPLRVPRGLINRMQKKDWHDPILRQVLPINDELEVVAGYAQDPLQESDANPVPGLLHKYDGRVLVTLTSVCAVNCRFCFRRAFPYAENNPGRVGWEKIFSYIANDTTIREVILSGGDPLAVNDSLLKNFSDQLSLIPHVKRLRIHTRIPVMLPERITESFIAWINDLKLNLVIVLHTNHANELNDEVKQAMDLLRKTKAHLLNQTVLLRGINDNNDALITLHEKLFSFGILPYYLHVLDKVQGAAHFDMPRNKAHELHQAMVSKLPGYLVPRLVCEEAGKPAKTLLITA